MSKNDSKIKVLLKKVEDMKKDLGTRPRVSLETNGVFKYDSNCHININTINSKSVLVKACAFIMMQKKFMQEAKVELGFSHTEETKWDNYPVDSWIADFKSRASILEWEEKNKKLKTTEKQLNQLISEDAKTELALESIEAELGI